MPDVAAAIKLLQDRYPGATVGLDNGRPYARMPDGALYGVLFGGPVANEDRPERIGKPLAIVQYIAGQLSKRNLIVVERLDT